VQLYIRRLKANIRRLTHAESQLAGVLRELLQIEFKGLSHNARSSPCTAALNEVMAKTNQQSTVLVISNQNHDAESPSLQSIGPDQERQYSNFSLTTSLKFMEATFGNISD
jgi:hypothetical protein